MEKEEKESNNAKKYIRKTETQIRTVIDQRKGACWFTKQAVSFKYQIILSGHIRTTQGEDNGLLSFWEIRCLREEPTGDD